MSKPRIILLPGLGADERMYAPQREAGLRIEVPAWVEPRDGETLSEYAIRMAQRVDESEPYYLGGASFGGMVALEMARHLRPCAVLAISTAYSINAVPRRVTRMDPVTRPLPPVLFKPVASMLIGTALMWERPPRTFSWRMVKMYFDTPAKWFKWAALATRGWRFRGDAAAPVYHIHGDRDRLLPAAGFTPDHWVRGGGHLIHFTHRDEVNEWLRRRTNDR